MGNAEEQMRLATIADLTFAATSGAYSALSAQISSLRAGKSGISHPFDADMADIDDAFDEAAKTLVTAYIQANGVGTIEAKRFDEYGCYVWIDGGCLMNAEIGDYLAAREDQYGEITAPESQEFLDAVNKAFGSSFQLEGFAGR